MAKHGRDLANFKDNFSLNEMQDIFTSCANSLSKQNTKSRTTEELELLIFHARQINDEKTLLSSEAEKFEIDARRSKQKFLWENAAKKWVELRKYGRAGRAYENAKNFKESSRCYNEHGKSLDNFRKSALEHLARIRGDNQKVKIGLMIPSFFNEIQEDFAGIFDFVPNEKFYNLNPWYNLLDSLRGGPEIEKIISRIKKQQHKDNPRELAKLNFETGEITKALEIMRENGLFSEGFRDYGRDLTWKQIEVWSDANDLLPGEKLVINKIKFEQINHKSDDELVSFIKQCMLTHSDKGEGEAFDEVITLILSPRPLDDEDFIPILKNLLEHYQSDDVVNCAHNNMLLHLIRLCLLRIIDSTEKTCGEYLDYEKILLMRYCELLCKYTRHPNRTSSDAQYRQIRNIVFTLIFETNLFDPIDILYDWLIASEDFPTKSKLAVNDLASLMVFFGDDEDERFPFYSHGFNPESAIYSSREKIKPSPDIVNYIYDEKFKIYKEGRRKNSGYLRVVLKYRETDDEVYDKEWWREKEGRFLECLRDIFNLKDDNNHSFDDSSLRQRIEKINVLIPEDEEFSSDESMHEIDEIEDDFEVETESEFEIDVKPIALDDINLETVDIVQEQEIQQEGTVQSMDISLAKSIDRYKDQDDPFDYLLNDIGFNTILEISDSEKQLEILYQLNDQTRRSLEDDKFPSDEFAAAIWMLGDKLRQTMMKLDPPYKCNDYNPFQQEKWNSLKRDYFRIRIFGI